MADAETLGIELLPADDAAVEPEADLAAAEQAALDDVPAEAGGPDAPEPLGMTWEYDFDGDPPGFVRRGEAPAEVRGADSVRQWCLMTIHSARYAHDAFSDDFGMEEPEDPIGETWNSDLLADYRDRLTEGLLVHDRIVAVVNFEAFFDPQEGVLEIDGFDVVLDDDSLVNIGATTVRVEGGL